VTTQDVLKNSVLPTDLATDGCAGVDFYRHHAGSERAATSGAQRTGADSGPDRSGADRPDDYLCYGYADRLAAAIGQSGMNVLLRLSSFLLVCIGVQIFWNGLSALVKTLNT
jgi:MarC family integral membrane protein